MEIGPQPLNRARKGLAQLVGQRHVSRCELHSEAAADVSVVAPRAFAADFGAVVPSKQVAEDPGFVVGGQGAADTVNWIGKTLVLDRAVVQTDVQVAVQWIGR